MKIFAVGYFYAQPCCTNGFLTHNLTKLSTTPRSLLFFRNIETDIKFVLLLLIWVAPGNSPSVGNQFHLQ